MFQPAATESKTKTHNGNIARNGGAKNGFKSRLIPHPAKTQPENAFRGSAGCLIQTFTIRNWEIKRILCSSESLLFLPRFASVLVPQRILSELKRSKTPQTLAVPNLPRYLATCSESRGNLAWLTLTHPLCVVCGGESLLQRPCRGLSVPAVFWAFWALS